MSNEGEKRCPLCAEEMDWTDQQLKPCQCGYEVCVWCWHHIMDMAEKDGSEGRCPACRSPYDKEKIVGMEAKCQRVVATKKDQKSKPQKAKLKTAEVTKDLTTVRVIQRKMAYVIGLPLRVADENLLQRKEYFGQYGKVSKVSLSRTAGGAIQQFVNDTCSVYITYSKEEEAIRCIQSVHGFVLEGRFLRASFGTAKYCHAWLRNMPCTNPSCLYLHSIGAEEDSFSKDEEAAVHTRNRVHQIVGATHNMQRRSGNMLPPPIDDPFNGSRVATDKAMFGSAQRDTAHATVTSSGHLSCSLSSKDKDGRIKTPNRTFVDIVGGSSSGPEKDCSVAEDRRILNLCSDFSSVSVYEDNHFGTEYTNSMLCKVPSSGHLPIGIARDKDFQGYFKPFLESSNFSAFGGVHFTSSDTCTVKGQSCLMSESDIQVLPGSCSDVREDLLSFDDQRSKGSDSLSQGSSVLSSCYPIRVSDYPNGHVQQLTETRSLSEYNVERSTVHNHIDETSIQFTGVNPALLDGYNERKFQSFAEASRNFRSFNSFSNEEIVEQLRRLGDDNITNDNDSSALDVVESSIISNILSMDFDSCDDSLTSSHSLADLLEGAGGRHGSWNFRKSDESRFSFAKQENSANQETGLDSSLSNIGQVSKKYSSVPDSMENQEHYFSGPRHHVFRTQSLTPPGFSVTSREPPPGFSACERTNQAISATSGSHLVESSSLPNGHYRARSAGNIINTRDFDFIDPAVLAVVRGKTTNVLNNSSFEARPTSTPQPTTYEDGAKLWHLMQQSGSTYQDTKFSPINPSAHQDLGYLGHSGNGFSPMSDANGFSSMLMDQHQNYNPFPGTQLSQQKYRNGYISNGYLSGLDEVRLGNEVGVPEISRNERLGLNKYLSGLDEVRLGNEVGVPEISRNERLGLNKYFPGYGDAILQMPGTGDVYNRVYGL